MPPVSEDKLVEKAGYGFEFCAFWCSASGMNGSRYELDRQDFYFFQDINQDCLEPCDGLCNNAVEFATHPRSDFEMCEKSFCDNYSKEKEEFCSDPKMKWDPEGCAHKLGHATFLTTMSSTAPTNVRPAVIRTVVEPASAKTATEPTSTSTTTASASTSTTTASTSTRKTTKKEKKIKASRRSKGKRSRRYLQIKVPYY